ncbi:hypothetical protein LBMAG42_19650 [Deltaproteobacteria bacterium]|nr:hypothetical protein LBMAG42_19650 [Deltaproteobacteria bacterium]
MITLIASLWLGSAVHRAEAAPAPELLALADAPLASSPRLAAARALLAKEGWEEAGIEALARLAADPEVGDAARGSLVDLLGRADARPSWSKVYAILLATPKFEGRDRVALRAAEVGLAAASTRKEALAELDRLLLFADPTATRAIGRVLLRGGEASRAQAAYARVEGAGAARELEALAALAAGDLGRVDALVNGGVTTPAVVAALADPTPINRASALAANGFVAAARRILEEAPHEETGRALAELYRAENALPEATAALLRYRSVHPDDEQARRALIDVYRTRERYAAAQALLTPAEAAGEPGLAALVAFRAAWESKSKSGLGPALEAAWRAAPEEPFVAREWAKARMDARHPEEALPALGAVLDSHPTDAEALGLYNLAAIATSTSASATRRQLAAATAARSSKQRSLHLAAAADMLVLQAEEAKRAGESDDAIEPYFTALLLADASVDDLLGAGGLLWQSQRLDGAAVLYREAARRAPRNVDALLSSVRLLLQTGHEADALLLLESSALNDKRVLLMHTTVLNAVRAKEARAAARSGDLETARLLWSQLAEAYPAEPEFLHGLGDVLAGLGEFDAAIPQYREAARLDPNDAWAVLGEANCLIALDRPEAARERIAEAYPLAADPVADREAPRVLAHAWRTTAEREVRAGANVDAFAAWREAFELDPEVWSLSGLAALYLERDQPEVALAFWEEALDLSATLQEALLGRAVALERLGRWDEARAAAAALDRPDATSVALSQRRELLQRLAVRQGEYERRMGDIPGAMARMRDAIKTVGPSADLWSALASGALDGHDCTTALDAVPRALIVDPRSRWAFGVALRAEVVCRAAADLHPLIQNADERAGGGFAAEELRASEFELTVQQADQLRGEGRSREAAGALRAAEGMPKLSADEWSRVGGAWLALAEPELAIGAYQKTLALEPNHVAAIVGIAGAYRAQVRLAAAEAHLQTAWDRVRDPRIGLQLVQTMLQRGEHDRAAATLEKVKHTAVPPEAPPVLDDPPEPFPVLPLPSGRTPGPRTWPPTPPLDQQPRWLVDLVDSVDVELARDKGLFVSAGGGAFVKPGGVGEQALDGWYIPVEAYFPPIGLVRVNADVVALHLNDGEDEALGVAPSVGVATAPFRRFFATARLGTSPLGFSEVNVLWHAHARYGLLPDLAMGVQSARTPVSDSLLSWAGKTSADGEFFGFLSQVSGSGYLSWTPKRLSLGAQLRGGYSEGYGVAPNALVEGVAWGAATFGNPYGNVKVGGQVVALHHDRQLDGFDPGQGGYFSPPVFVMAVAQLVGEQGFVGNRGRLCASLSAGPQFLDGRPTPWFGAGWSGTGRVGLGASWRLAPRWAVGVDGRAQLSTSGWHQEAAIGHLTWGLVPNGASAPTLSTTASAGAILPQSSDLCRTE